MAMSILFRQCYTIIMISTSQTLPSDNEVGFIRFCAISAMLSAVTTFLLWLLPKLYTPPETFEAGVRLHTNLYYIARLWVNFIHIPLALASYFGLVVVTRNRHPLLSLFGMGWFVVWGVIEMVGIAILVFSVNGNWRASYETADEVQQAVLKNNIQAFYSIWDSMFFVLLVAFLLGSVCYGVVTWGSSGLQRVLSYLIWLSVPLTLMIMAGGYAGQAWADEITGYIYPALQPISRFIMGIVIWRYAQSAVRTEMPQGII